MTLKAPGQHPDIDLQRDPSDPDAWLGRTWNVRIRRNGIPMVLTDSTVTVVVLDDDAREVSLSVDMTNAADGLVTITIAPDQMPALGRYSTWQLYEAPRYGEVIVQGRFVKQR